MSFLFRGLQLQKLTVFCRGMTCAKPFSGFQTCVMASVSRGAAFEIGLCGSQDTYTKSEKLTIGKSASGLYGPLVQLVYKATDMPPAGGTTSTAGTTTSVPGSAVSSNPSLDASDDSGGLSNGAKIGIGVGVPIGVLLLAALAFFLFRRRRKQHTSVPAEMTNAPPNEDKNLIVPGNQSPQPHKEPPIIPDQNIELDGTPARTVHELSAEASPR